MFIFAFYCTTVSNLVATLPLLVSFLMPVSDINIISQHLISVSFPDHSFSFMQKKKRSENETNMIPHFRRWWNISLPFRATWSSGYYGTKLKDDTLSNAV